MRKNDTKMSLTPLFVCWLVWFGLFDVSFCFVCSVLFALFVWLLGSIAMVFKCVFLVFNWFLSGFQIDV